jgi:ABC-type branched-subunit amino acid transport system substrate-binding protein
VRLTPARLAVLIAVVSLAACGSTVPAAQRRVASAGSNGEASLGASSAPGAEGRSVPAASADGTAGSAAGGSTGRAGGSPTRGPSVGSSSGGGAASVGGSHAPIEIGIGVDRNDAAFAAAFGVTTSQPAEKDVAAAVVADINKHGGLAGHPIAPVYSEFDNTSNDWIAQDQASCATFTQDHHVVAVVRNDDIFGPLDTCVANAGIPLVLYESYFRAPSWYRANGGLRFVPDNPAPSRLFGALVGRMVGTGRWTPATKIGLVRYDRSDQAEIETQAVRPALAARGLKLAAANAVHTPESFQDIGTTGGQMAAVVVRFRQAGVTDVVFEGGDLSYLFATAADAQGYAPHYALTSFDFPNGMPPDQLHGAFGVGWEPSDDLLTPLPVTPGVQRCQAATKATNADYAAAGVDRVYTTCDLLYWLKAVYDAAGDLGPGAVAVGAKRVAAAYAPAFTFAIDASAHPDGAAAYRDLSYDDKCSCLVYGQQSPLP